jgi:hypothetical protein
MKKVLIRKLTERIDQVIVLFKNEIENVMKNLGISENQSIDIPIGTYY